MIGIYKITNLDNGKMYIGQTTDIKHRWSEHISDLRHNKHRNSYLQNSWNLHGEDKFEFSILEICCEEELNEKEKYWIEELRTYIKYEDSNGYNLTLGGDGTQYIHYVLQFDLSGNYIQKWRNGIVASIELGIQASSIYGCINKRLKHAGKYIFCYEEDYTDKDSLSWYLDERKTAPVLQCDFDGNILNKWDGCAEATEYLGYSPITCLLGIGLTSHGYIYVYEDNYDKLTPDYLSYVKETYLKTRKKKVFQINNIGEIVQEYESINDAARAGFSERMVSECCNGLRNNTKGYIFCFEDDLSKLNKQACAELCKTDNSRIYRNVLQFDQDGNFIKKYDYLSDVVEDGFCSGNVSDCCRGLKCQYKGFIWKYGDIMPKKGSKPVAQYDKQKKLLNSFNSIKDAEKATGVNGCCISSNCNGKLKSTHGYIFEFIDD